MNMLFYNRSVIRFGRDIRYFEVKYQLCNL